MIYYTSDLYFGHVNVIKFDERLFDDVEQMDRVLIERWNERVQEDDLELIKNNEKFKKEETQGQ